METWATVALVIGSNIVVALSTFFVTKIQVSHSDKRLEKELARARETDYHQRQREVRGEPLLRLRDEFARMVAKLHTLVANAQLLPDESFDAKKEKQRQRTLGNWRDYLTSGDLLPSLFLQYDEEIIGRVKGIRELYLSLVNYALEFHEYLADLKKIPQRIEDSIRGIQELINQKLEEL